MIVIAAEFKVAKSQDHVKLMSKKWKDKEGRGQRKRKTVRKKKRKRVWAPTL